MTQSTTPAPPLTSRPIGAPPALLKSSPVAPFGVGLRQSDGLSDTVIDLTGYNAVSVFVQVVGTPGATLTIEGGVQPGGPWLVFPDSNATQASLNTSKIFDVVACQNYCKARLAGGNYAAGAGYFVWVVPCVAPGYADLSITGAISSNISQVSGGSLTLGQAAMAASLPVVLASNQSAVPVDTELPAAAALGDATANPTTPLVGSPLLVFNGTTWDRARTVPGADAQAVTGLLASGVLFYDSAGGVGRAWRGGMTDAQGATVPAVEVYAFNGTNRDRLRTSSVGTGLLTAAPPDYSYTHLAANATTTIKSGAGILHAIAINTLGTADTITVYDNTAGSGTVIAVINSAVSQGTLVFDAKFSTGLTLVLAGTTPPDITVTWR